MPPQLYEIVTFQGGLSMPLEPWLLAIDLDLKGLRLVAEGSMLRVLGPNGKPELSAHERAEITRWKYHLLALVEYCAQDHHCKALQGVAVGKS